MTLSAPGSIAAPNCRHGSAGGNGALGLGRHPPDAAAEKRLPFDVTVPNAESQSAIAELEAGKGKRFKSAEALFDDLGI